MENENEFLKQKMNIDELGIHAPDLSLVSEARKKVLTRKKLQNRNENLFSMLARILNFRIKLYQAGIATMLIGVGIFFITKKSDNNNETKTRQYAEVDSLKSSSVKDNILFVKNFTSKIN